ncbi:hypothetical protein [uncultured Thiohalocapsa sp.]|uniref:hypothetical protein n=1 Tax=uncultured Thiohalocapsa sp. TaxID=768990 RepID=UPI0025DA7545|nr:hypothetical protein [uncultured Thiohalocapsa sp.]
MTEPTPLPPGPSRIAKQAAARDAAEPPPGTIVCTPGYLDDAVQAVGRALAASASALGLYQHGDTLTRVAEADDTERPGISRAPGSPVLRPVDNACLAVYISRVCELVRWDGRKNDYSAIDPPRRVVDGVASIADRFGFPDLRGFISAPIVTPDGRVIAAPGYDEATGLYLAAALPLPPTPDSPTKLDASAALDYLAADILGTFAQTWATPADESAAVAAILTVLLRRILPTAPIVAIDATTPGSGKTLLAEVFATIATNRPPALVSLTRDAAETEKRIGAVLMAGDAVINHDNLSFPLRSDIHCQMATAPEVALRVLGASRVTRVPTNVATLITGNNLTLLGDLPRRVLRIGLDPRCEHPERRRFDRDAVAHARAHRAAAVAAALTLVRAYLIAGAPDVGVTPYGSFELWDRMVRRPVVWAGFPDPLDAAADLSSQDHELTAVADLLAAWHDQYGDRPMTAPEVIRDAEAQLMTGQTRHQALADAIQEATGHRQTDARALGNLLRGYAGRWLDGRRVVKGKKSRAGMSWAVEVNRV